MSKRNPQGESAVNILEKVYKIMEEVLRAMDVPMMEKIRQAVEKAVEDVDQSEVH